MGKKIKVIQINSNFGKSGAGKIVKALHEYYTSNGLDSFVAYGRDFVDCNDKNVYQIGNKISVYFHVLMSRVLGLNGYSSKIATKKLIKHIDDIEPNIVHLHGIHGYYLNYFILFSYLKKKNIPVLWTFHDCQAFTGKCGYHYECIKYCQECGECPYLKDYPTSLLFDHTRKMYNDKKKAFLSIEKMTIVTPSDWLTRDVDNSFFKNVRHVTINNGIDNVNVFRPNNNEKLKEKYGLPVNKKIIIGVAYGFNNPRKGFKYLKQLAIDRPLYHFIFIGAEKRMVEDVKNIECIPFIKDQEVLRDYYSLADVLVLPSLSENYATVGLESMSCGTPIACFDVGGNYELIKEGKHGICVNKGDGVQLAKAVDTLLNTEIDTEQMYNTMVNENSFKTMAEKYIKEYKLLLGNQ